MSTLDLTRLDGFDLETTGVDPFEDRIVQAAHVRVHGNDYDDPDGWLVDPGVDIPTGASDVHGITTERAQAEGGDPGTMLAELTTSLASSMSRVIPIVIANAPYDLTMLEAENARHAVKPLAERLAPRPIGPVIDPMVLDRYADPYRKGICPCGCGAQNKTLTGLCLHYGVTLADAHDAGADALAAVLLTRAVVARHPAKFRGLTVGGLHMAQIGWKREQADSLRSFWKRTGDERWREVSGDWPLRTALTPAEAQGVLL